MSCPLSDRGEHWDDYTARRNQNYSQNRSLIDARGDVKPQRVTTYGRI